MYVTRHGIPKLWGGGGPVFQSSATYCSRWTVDSVLDDDSDISVTVFHVFFNGDDDDSNMSVIVVHDCIL